MSDYTYNDMMKMQEEAKKRVLEMQRRSKSFAEDFNNGLNENRKTSERNSEEEKLYGMLPDKARVISMPVELPDTDKNKTHAEHIQHNSGQTDSVTNGQTIKPVLKNIFGDMSNEETEKMLILSLCLLLQNENADDTLVLALMYLLT